jgi:hypothetical protein
MEKYTRFNEKRNTLYILSSVIMPPRGSDSHEIREAFRMTYEERLNKYCPAQIKEQILEEIRKHKGCKISEFDYIL